MINRKKVRAELERRFGSLMEPSCLRHETIRVFLQYKRKLIMVDQLPFWLEKTKERLQSRTRIHYLRQMRKLGAEETAQSMLDRDGGWSYRKMSNEEELIFVTLAII